MSALVEMATGMQYQQNFPQQQTQDISLPIQEASSYLAAVSGNNYAKLRRKLRRRQQLLKQNRRNMQTYRQPLEADTNNYGAYAATAPAHPGPSYGGYSSSTTGGEYHDYTPDSHVPTGGGVPSYQPNTGSGYAAGPVHQPYPPVNDPHPHPHPHQHSYVAPQPPPVYHAPTYSFTKPSKGKMRSKKKQGDSTISALTLLSFFFFVNLLQNCLKEHMNTMNPTVMVMTVNGVRNRFNKLAEMNSREQNAAVASDTSSSNIAVLQPTDLQGAATSEVLVGQSPYSSDLIHAHKADTVDNNNKHNNNNNNKDVYYPENNSKNIAMANANKQHNNNYNGADDDYTHSYTNTFSNQSMRPEFYDSIHSYRRRNYSTPKDFSAYFRSSSAGSDKSHNYSFQNNMHITRASNTAEAYSFDKSYDSSLGVTTAPTSYWSLAAVTSSASDFFQHHSYDDNDADDIERRYAFDNF